MKFASLVIFIASFFIVHVNAVDFETEIQPILKQHCAKCHSGPKARRKIDYMKTSVLKGLIGDEEHHIIKPGKPDESLLLKLASLPQSDSGAMPPPKSKGTPLNSSQLALIKKWISEGASLEKGTVSTEETAEKSKAEDVNKVYEWTSVTGSKIEATFISYENGEVTLHRLQGNQVTVPLEKLSEDSQELVKKLAE